MDTEFWSKENREKAERARQFFLFVEDNAAAMHDWMLVEGKSKEYAEKLFGMEFAD